MKQIKTSNNYIAIVDDEDYEYLNQWKWYCHHGYACRTTKKGKLYIHRIVFKAVKKQNIDHINGNSLDNRKENLRVATVSQNGANSKKRLNCSSKYKGVSWNKFANMWKARINYQKKEMFLGYYKNEIEAALAYNQAAIKYFGEFAKLNDIKQEKS